MATRREQRRAGFARGVFLGCALAAQLAGAATVYKSVDEQGRVTFSDQPPAAGKVEVLQYHIAGKSRSALDTARLEAMRETTDRMAADRREREAARARARSQAAAQRAAAAPTYVYPEDRYYSSAYLLPGRPLVRPPQRPPHVRPPHLRPPSGRPPAAAFNPKQFRGPGNIVRRNYSGRARDIFYGR